MTLRKQVILYAALLVAVVSSVSLAFINTDSDEFSDRPHMLYFSAKW